MVGKKKWPVHERNKPGRNHRSMLIILYTGVCYPSGLQHTLPSLFKRMSVILNTATPDPHLNFMALQVSKTKAIVYFPEAVCDTYAASATHHPTELPHMSPYIATPQTTPHQFQGSARCLHKSWLTSPTALAI